MTKIPRESCHVTEDEIIRESQHWVRKNDGVEVNREEFYTSPRLSSELPDCSMPMTFDHYNYCSMGCLYCFAYFFKSNNPAIKRFFLKAVDLDKMIQAISGNPQRASDKLFWKHFYSKKFLLHWGGLADPFDGFEAKNNDGLKLIKALGELNYPCLFSFKGPAIFQSKYVKTFEKYAKQSNFAFQISMVTADNKMAQKVEIGVPLPSRRLEAIKLLSDMGYWTILRLRPYIIGITDQSIDELLERALEAGIKGVSMEFFALDCRSNEGMKTRYSWLAHLIGVPNLLEYFSATSPSERGGYMRSNRLVKESHVKKVYQFCIQHGLVFGCSDPDYKELNTSGSCCAMPDKFPKNKLLENWSRDQMTFHLKEARKCYHCTGKCRLLKFHEVYSDKATYMDATKYADGHPTVIGRDCAERVNLTPRIITQEQWNNLKSPACPRNYFHGKVMPAGLDEHGNFMFRYTPSEYEDRWIKEGIDLKT